MRANVVKRIPTSLLALGVVIRASIKVIGISALVLLVLAADEVWRPPAFSDVAVITVWTPSNWFLHIKPDGSARFYGSAADRGANAPTNTFAFSEVYDLLSKTVQKDSDNEHTVQSGGNSQAWFIVTFDTPGRQPSYLHTFTRDTNTIRSLFDLAKLHCIPEDKQQFEKQWSERPPVIKP